MYSDMDWKAAEVSIRRANELAPESPMVLRSLGALAHTFGRLEEARTLFLRALEVDPLSADLWVALAHTTRALDRLGEARDATVRARELVPHRIIVHLVLALIDSAEGRHEEALAALAHEPADWARLTGLVVVHHAAGRPAESDEALRLLIERHAETSAYQIATVAAARGESDRAFEWVERAFEQHDAGLAFTAREPLFRSLHADPRWHPMLVRLGVAD
jgi:tetratricopeptide (TPR) repeat protein